MQGCQALGGGRTTVAQLELAAASMAAASRSSRAAPESEGGRVGRRVSAGQLGRSVERAGVLSLKIYAWLVLLEYLHVSYINTHLY